MIWYSIFKKMYWFDWSDFYASMKNSWFIFTTELYNRELMMYSANSIYRR